MVSELIKVKEVPEIKEIPEIWTSSVFNSIAKIDPKNFETSRIEIVNSIQKWYVKNFKDIYQKIEADPFSFQKIRKGNIEPKLKSAKDENKNLVHDKYNNEVKYLEFKSIPIIIDVEKRKIRCKFAIRINICNENKSKVIGYLYPIGNHQFNSRTTFIFCKIAKIKLEKIVDFFSEQYKKNSHSEDLNYKIYIYNIGTNNAIVHKYLTTSNYENIVENMNNYPDFERAFLDVVGITHGKYFVDYEDYLRNVEYKHTWTMNIDDKKQLFTLFAQRFDYENNKRICEYSGLTNSGKIVDIHSMDRRLVFSFINEF
jgi:hypothetical protein